MSGVDAASLMRLRSELFRELNCFKWHMHNTNWTQWVVIIFKDNEHGVGRRMCFN